MDAVAIETNTQVAPYPEALAELIENMRYRPGWLFHLEHVNRGQGSEGLTLSVTSLGYDTYHPERGETYRVIHYFPVPPAAFDKRAWERWLLDCLIEIETHECCEFFRFEEEDVGRRPFAPNHGPGRNPYSILEVGRIEDAETSFKGERKEGSQI